MLRIRSERVVGVLRALSLAVGALAIGASAQALTVFACEPEWAALVQQLAPAAKVHIATHSRQDPHHIEARPSLIAALRRADLAVCTGAELEAGWLPVLQQRSGNARVQEGAPGMFNAADQVYLIDPRPAGSPFDGDVHARGNPHVHLDPARLLKIAQALSERLQQIDPAQRAAYQTRMEAFESDWTQRIADWERRAAPLKGLRVAVQHSTYAYLWRWLKVDVVADLEPRPDMPPTPGHLQRVLAQTRESPPQAVVVSTYQDARSAQWLARQAAKELPVLQLPSTVTGDATADATADAAAPNLPALFDHLIGQLLTVVR